MIEVKKGGILLSKTDLEFENEAVLNPAVIHEGESVHMYYRAVRTGNHSTLGYCRLAGPLTIEDRWTKPIDSHIACVSLSFSGLIAELLSYKIKDEKSNGLQ